MIVTMIVLISATTPYAMPRLRLAEAYSAAVAAANSITQNFDGIADALVEGLDDIAALKERPLPGIPVVSNIAYLGMYPDATVSALAIGAIIELIPLAVIVLGMSMMERANMPRVPSQPSPVAPPAIALQPKRQYKRRTPKSDA